MTEKFAGRLAFDETLSVKAGKLTITARLERDDDMGPPWKEHDGHGPVSEWTRRKKLPGERVLSESRGSYRYYDMAEATKIARRDGWDAPPYGEGTPGQRAARAAEEDFQRMRAWCRDEWFWVSVVLSASRAGITLDSYAACLCGIESDAGDYLTEVANELLPEAIEAAERIIEAVTS